MAIAGCADRDAAPIVTAAMEIGTVQKIFVATTRGRDVRGYLNRDRADGLSYHLVDVSVPPDHRPGRLEQGFDKPDPRQHFVIAGQQGFADQAAFRTSLARQIRSRPKGDREVAIYVHGYNNSFSDGVFRVAQLRHDLDLPGTAVHFSWPSAGNPLGYTYDRDSVLIARDGLEKLLRDVAATKPRNIVLTGHSMGALLIMETLRQIELRTPDWAERNLSGVVLLSPDIDLDLFKAQAGQIAHLPQPFAIFVSEKDRALQLSRALNGSRKRLGALTDPQELAELPVLLVDVTDFTPDRGAGHFVAGTSEALIRILSRITQIDDAFRTDRAGRPGLLPGTAITVRNATQLILSPQILLGF